MTGLQLQSSQRGAVIVAVNANRTTGSVEAVEWALKYVVKPGDVLLILGVFTDHPAKKNSCFPVKLLMGLAVSGIYEALEFVDHEEVDSVELEEEFERKREEYWSILQPLYRQCSKNEVSLVLKLAAGFCPARLAIKESQNLITLVDGIAVHQGILQDTPVSVKSLQITNKGFRSILEILSRNIQTELYQFVVDELAEKLEWGARWSIALEIGGRLRYLHEECVDEPIVHKIFSASSIALSHGYSAMLITGKCVRPVHDQGKDPMIEWALPLLENGELGKLMDCRLKETAGDARMAIAIVRGDELAISNH
ncbi:unnamed protein product [Malus baccata var. baccata]